MVGSIKMQRWLPAQFVVDGCTNLYLGYLVVFSEKALRGSKQRRVAGDSRSRTGHRSALEQLPEMLLQPPELVEELLIEPVRFPFFYDLLKILVQVSNLFGRLPFVVRELNSA